MAWRNKTLLGSYFICWGILQAVCYLFLVIRVPQGP
ncbi:hypothetical protein Pjdr2_5205 [Paenibacillus sp. JDR-2]|nr:hypothetical protein Pjdr2_5205 [Paenibacillus sp. JDR-2]